MNRRQAHIRNFLADMELDCLPDIGQTPKRFTNYIEEFCRPLDIEKIFSTKFAYNRRNHVDDSGFVVQVHIPFRMVCSHHLLPALGRAAIGYLPDEYVIGLSKLTRLVQGVGTESPTLQEVACNRMADLLDVNLAPRGCIVVIQAEHTCMAARGVNRDRVLTVTRACRGALADKKELRTEFYELCKTAGG